MEITTAKEAQELAAVHFAICSTNPRVNQEPGAPKKVELNGQRDAAAEERATRAVDQQTSQEPQTTTRVTLDTENTPDNYKLFLAKYERNRDSCQKPHNHNPTMIALKLWD